MFVPKLFFRGCFFWCVLFLPSCKTLPPLSVDVGSSVLGEVQNVIEHQHTELNIRTKQSTFLQLRAVHNAIEENVIRDAPDTSYVLTGMGCKSGHNGWLTTSFLLNDKKYEADVMAESRLNHSLSLLTGLRHSEHWNKKRSNTYLHAGVEYHVNAYVAFFSEYWVGNSDLRRINDWVFFGIRHTIK